MTVRDPDNSDIIGALQLLRSKKMWFIITCGNFPLQKNKETYAYRQTNKRQEEYLELGRCDVTL